MMTMTPPELRNMELNTLQVRTNSKCQTQQRRKIENRLYFSLYKNGQKL